MTKRRVILVISERTNDVVFVSGIQAQKMRNSGPTWTSPKSPNKGLWIPGSD